MYIRYHTSGDRQNSAINLQQI